MSYPLDVGVLINPVFIPPFYKYVALPVEGNVLRRRGQIVFWVFQRYDYLFYILLILFPHFRFVPFVRAGSDK